MITHFFEILHCPETSHNQRIAFFNTFKSRIRAIAILQGSRSKELTLKLPDNSIIEAVYERTFNYNAGSFSVVYKILNQDHSQLVLSEYNGTITGMYQAENNKK